MKNTKSKETQSQTYQAALKYLSIRDHSKKELFEKLKKKYPTEEINQVLTELIETGLLNENKYTEHYIYFRRRKGYGPKRIAIELEMRGISHEMIAEQLRITDNAWLQDLRKLWQKQFKGQSATDFKTKTKQMRFLYYRGFTQEQIENLFKIDENP